MTNKSKCASMKPMGIYALETCCCGCQIKHYIGGKTITIKHKKCDNHIAGVSYICRVCKKQMTKRELKDHKWSHVN